MKKQTKYPIRVQAIRSKGHKERPYVNIPVPLAAAIGLEGGEEVEWELLNRDELHLVRHHAPPPRTKRHTRPPTA